MSLLFWFFLLVIQNAAFTLVSRARNSGSYGFHAIAAVSSNGIFFAVQFLTISMVVDKNMSLNAALVMGAFYIIATTIGSVGMHWISINYLEKGKRKVGS